VPILNYTTEVESAKTVGEIQSILAKHGAKVVIAEYDDAGEINGLAFVIIVNGRELSIRLPVNPNAVLAVMKRPAQKVPYRLQTRAQAVRVAWRIVKQWVEAQMAMFELEQAKMEQIFLPYVMTPSGATFFEVAEKQLLLTQPKEVDNAKND
jgi:hypothetical protein